MPSSSSSSPVVFPASKYKWLGQYHIPIKFFYKNRAVTFKALVDTGSTYTVIGSEEARQLGLNIEDGVGPYSLTGTISSLKGKSYYIHKLKVQIGNLKPVTVTVMVTDSPADIIVIGWADIFRKLRVTTSSDELSIENFLTAVVPFINKGKVHPDAYIYLLHIETGKPVKIPMTIDTGGYHNTVDIKYKRLLGIDDKTATGLRKFRSLDGRLGYALKMKLAPNLRPITTDVYFQTLPESWEGVGMLGMGTLLKDKNSYNITFEKDRVIYEETFYGTRGVSNSARNYRMRYV